ncbi:Blue-light-activated protein [Enhygromyxa salina]|uniref:histidine kinase n=1 Tax=Enhygromyxa salina TaxID=215803 RepID=A0A2S9XBE5_9BACT|nr:ATP-binding protein [Enhygromyxa salina]PRP90166.1 Blue-light-activated protein [Enhygromyxa salina]
MDEAGREVGVCLLDADGSVIELDADFCHLAGLAQPAAMIGRPLHAALAWAPALPDEGPTRSRHEGKEFAVELVCRRASTAPIAYIVTARRERNESTLARQLRVARQTLDSVIEASPLAILTVDHDKRVVMWNRAAERTFGWTHEEVLGEPYPLVPADELPAFERLFDQVVLQGEGFTGVESTRVRKDGSRVDLRMHTAPLLDAEGRVTGGMALLEDLTHTRELEERVRHSQKMEAVGRLAGGIAHDFNNLLTVVIGMCDLLECDEELSPQSRAHVSEILHVGNSARELIAQLMTFSRKQVVRPRVVDLNHRLQESGKMLRHLLDKSIELQIEVARVRLPVKLDPSQFDQVLVNLAVNAADAMPRGGRLSYATSVRVLEADEAEPLEAGPHVCLTVTDTGTGIPADVLPHIFDPFFTTKAAGSGTGLGLANVYGVVRQNGGNVEVHSVEGEGTSFRVYLPLAKVPAQARSRTNKRTIPRGSERILIVEDNDSVRVTTAKLLETLGYQVNTACDGADALEMVAAGLEVDLVLSDLAMPRIGGAELVKRLHERTPELPVIIMSGNLDAVELRAEVEQGRARFLQKPVSLRQLARSTREALDARPKHNQEQRLARESGEALA